jgi:phospholipase/carboxylesterase
VSPVLPAVEINPQGTAVATVLWLHGLGADGHDFEGIVPLLDLPEVRFVFPHAPKRPVTVNGGFVMPAWYDIRTLGDGKQELEDEPGIRESARAIETLIARESERGVPPSRVVTAGFSQGGALALHVGSRYREALMGIMVLSAYEVLSDTRRDETLAANRMTPILFCHGTYDATVPIAAGREAYAGAAAPGRPAEWHEFPIAHEVSPEEIEVIARWLQERVAALPGGGPA